jgi:hypothetical protein
VLCFGTLSATEIRALEFTDVDKNKLSIADGLITIIVLARTDEVDKARLVGDRLPEDIIGSATHRFITILQFEKSHSGPARMIANVVARHRLDAEAKRLQPRYALKKLARNPRQDVHAVLDFDGTIATLLGVKATPPVFQVLVLGRNGELLRRWTEVPKAEELAAILK